MEDAAKRAGAVVPGMSIQLPGGTQLDHAIAEAIRAAVAAERKRCAKLADAVHQDALEWQKICDEDAKEWEECRECTARDIAVAIREGAPAPAWSKTPPTVPGWCWHKDSRGQAWCVLVEWWKGGPQLSYTMPGSDAEWHVEGAGEWCGPIEVPS